MLRLKPSDLEAIERDNGDGTKTVVGLRCKLCSQEFVGDAYARPAMFWPGTRDLSGVPITMLPHMSKVHA